MKKFSLLLVLFLCGISLFSVPIKIFTNPGNVSVYLDGNLLGISDRQGVFSEMFFINEGNYTFKGEKPGFNSYEINTEIEESTTVTLKLIPSGMLAVNTVPQEAKISVNGNETGNGSIKISLPVGKHLVNVDMEGYTSRSFYVDIKQYFTKTLDVELTREGRTKIVTNPSDVDISVDGMYLGRSPIETNLKPGNHIVTFNRKWYYPETQTVNIKPEGTTEFFQELRAYSHLEIKTEPEEVRIFLDGTEKGMTPLKLMELTPGKHTLRYESSEFKPVTEEIFLNPGENIINRKLFLKEYEITFESTPAAIVMVDSVESGMTPMKKSFTHGSHEIYFRSGELEWKTTIEITGPQKVSANLYEDSCVSFYVIPEGDALVMHNGMEYYPREVINTKSGIQTFDIVRGGYPVRRRVYKLAPGTIYDYEINLQGEASLFVVTDPTDAQVYWMGEFIGNTPLRDTRVRPGTGMLKIVWTGGELEDRQTLLDGQTYTIFRRIPGRTMLYVDSFPSGLEIRLDGESLGPTPIAVEVSAGPHDIECIGPEGFSKLQQIKLTGETQRKINFVF